MLNLDTDRYDLTKKRTTPAKYEIFGETQAHCNSFQLTEIFLLL